MTKTELEQALKEANAKNIELEQQIKELSSKPDCEQQLKPLQGKITELTTTAESLAIQLKDKQTALNEAFEVIEGYELNKVEKDLPPSRDADDLFDKVGEYTDEQIADMPTDFVVIDGMTGLTRLPDGGVINSQFMAMNVSDVGARRLILVGKVDGKVTVEADIRNMEIRQFTKDGKTIYKLQAV